MLHVCWCYQHSAACWSCEEVLKCMSCTVRIDQGRAVCLESAGTKEFLNEPLVSAGYQIREQVCIVSSAGPRLCMEANTKFLQASFDVVEEALGP